MGPIIFWLQNFRQMRYLVIFISMVYCCSALLHLIAGWFRLTNIVQYTVHNINNVGSKTLFNPVFINPEQVVHFLLCRNEESAVGRMHEMSSRNFPPGAGIFVHLPLQFNFFTHALLIYLLYFDKNKLNCLRLS